MFAFFFRILCLSIFFFSSVFAQQTIINLPSADQTPAGKFFVLHESQARVWQPNPYWSTTNFLVYGVSHQFELCLTQYQFGVPAEPYGAIGIGYKYTAALFAEALSDLELKWTAGQMLAFSTTGKGVDVWTYLLGSFRLPYLATRLAAGISFGARPIFGTTGTLGFLGVSTTHFIASFEQPLGEHFTLVAEWFAGTSHEQAYFIPGLTYHSKALVVIVGYKIANSADKQILNGFVIEFGKFF